MTENEIAARNKKIGLVMEQYRSRLTGAEADGKDSPEAE